MDHTKTGRDAGCIAGARLLVAALAVLAAAGCQTTGGTGLTGLAALAGTPAGDAGEGSLYRRIPPEKPTTATRRIAAEGIKALDERDYRRASDVFNLALKTDINNSYLQFLNGLAYHLRGLNGESSLYPLAEQGYQLAAQFDDSNWLAHYYRGLLHLDQREFARARRQLAEASLYVSEPDLLYNLAIAAYYAHDPKTSAAALEGLRRLRDGAADDPRTMRASAIVSAALNQPEEAKRYLDRYREVSARPDQVAVVEERVRSWTDLHARADRMVAQYGAAPTFGVQGGGYPAAPAAPAFGVQAAPSFAAPVTAPMPGADAGALRAPTDFVEKQMVVVDVVIISTEEEVIDSMGVNLLQGLQLQFGSPGIGGQPALSSARRKIFDPNNPLAENSSTLTRLISIPAVTYTLNIANSNTRRNEVLARPTLVALGGQQSQFFSGVAIKGAAVSGGDGAAATVDKTVGVKLSVTPEFLPGDLIKLQVIAERSFITTPSANVVFSFRLDTTETNVHANVVMRFGETLILSGLSERDQETRRDGVPLLQDVPLLQYGFSKKTERDTLKSVLVLLTPRRTQYTYRADAQVAEEREAQSDDDRALADFEAKFKDWFRPVPNTGIVFQHLQDNLLYREFRTGDLSMQSWSNQRTHDERLKSAIDFIFY